MKKIATGLFTICISIGLLFTACKKSNDSSDTPGPGPDALDLKEGFLTTKTGINIGTLGDTAIIRVYTSSYQVAGTINGARPESPDHYWYIEGTGNAGQWYIRSKKLGLYLGYRPSTPSGGYTDWGRNWPTLDKTPTTKNIFVANKNGNKFYIQPIDDKTLYLNTTLVSQISYTGPARAEELHFLETKQEFFFLKPF